MSIKLNAQSGGSVALDAPTQTTGSADNVYKLPIADGSAGQVLQTDGSGNLSWVSPGGITVADQYRLNTQTACNNAIVDLTSNLERTDTSGQGHLGTGMTESSGIFTFPSTGIYKVDFQFNAFSTSDVRYVGGRVFATIDNSNYTKLSDSSDGIANVSGSSSWATSQTSTLVDVTNTSNVKVKFQIYASGNVTFQGHSSENWTFMTFIRLGDT